MKLTRKERQTIATALRGLQLEMFRAVIPPSHTDLVTLNDLVKKFPGSENPR